MCIVWLIHPNNINLNHRGRANDRVSTICLVLVKIYGNNPKKLLNKIIENKVTKIRVLPLTSLPNKVLNSKCSVVIIFIQRRFIRDGINQNIDGTNRIHRAVLSQFKLSPKFVVGSNDEKRLIIIFK